MPYHHSCYFHKQNPITHFCTRSQCTLPMCSQCLPIHIQQHTDQNKNKGVITFIEAEHQATSTLKNTIHTQSKYKSECHYKIQQTKSDMIKLIDLFFGDLKVKVDQQYLQISEVEKKLMKIQKGSLKSLIYFFSQSEPKFNDKFKTQIFVKIQNALTSLKSSITSAQKKQRAQQKAWKTQQQAYTNNHDLMQIELKQKQNLRQRGYSFDSNQQRSKKLLNIKSSVNLQSETTAGQLRSNQIRLNNNLATQTEGQNYKRLSSDRSMKIINRCQVQSKQSINRNTRKQYQYIEQDKYSGNTTHQVYETQSQRMKEIQKIRVREQQKQTQRQKQLQAQQLVDQARERQKQRQRERQRQRQQGRQKERELERQRLIQQSLERQKQMQQQRERQNEKVRIRTLEAESQKFRQNYKKQTDNFYSKNNFSYGETVKYEKSYGLGSIESKNQYIRIEQQVNRKPLQVADLNIQSRTATGKVSKSFTFSKQLDTKPGPSDNIFQMNKEVMSPQQIRRMLEKRIQERSRLLSKHPTQSHTPPKKTQSIQYKVSTNFSKSKQYTNNCEATEGEARWDTKDSIINQIYQDYRY